MQCKDIPTEPILHYLLKHKGQWCGWWGEERNVSLAMPAGIPSRLILAKMKQLIKRDLVIGCACGCRGDFSITPKGEQYLNHQPI